MRVAILTPWFPSPHEPYAGAFVLAQAEALSQIHEVVVIHPQQTPLKKFFQRGQLPEQRSDRLTVYRPIFRFTFLIFFLPDPIKSWIAHTVCTHRIISQLQRKNRFSVLHAHVSLPSGAAAVVVGTWARLPVVVTEHASPLSALTSQRGGRWLCGLAFRRAAAVIVVSSAAQRELRTHFPSTHSTIIPNAVNTSNFTPGRSTHQSPRAVAIGQMNTDQKGIDILLQAIARDPQSNLQLTIVGNGIRRPEYQSLATSLGLTKRVQFVDPRQPSQMPELFRQFDFLILPSRYESFGVVLIEALAAGLPVVATRCGGPEDIVTAQSGILVEPNSPASLADGIQAMIQRQASFAPTDLHTLARSRFGFEVIRQQLEGLYQGVGAGV